MSWVAMTWGPLATDPHRRLDDIADMLGAGIIDLETARKLLELPSKTRHSLCSNNATNTCNDKA